MERITVNARRKGEDGYIYDRWNRMTPTSLARWQGQFAAEHPVIAAAYDIRPPSWDEQPTAWAPTFFWALRP